VEAAADVPLVRPRSLRALPLPDATAPRRRALEDLAALLNVGRGAPLMLALSWLVGALLPEGPHAILAVDGEPGARKTTASRILRRLVDPNLADLRPLPGSERDLVVAAVNARVLASTTSPASTARWPTRSAASPPAPAGASARCSRTGRNTPLGSATWCC
jgi:hypothetical protein